jgi:hypothetical protein
MSPRNFAKHQLGPYFVSSPHFTDHNPKKVTLIDKFVNLFRSPVKNAADNIADQSQPEAPEVEVDLKALREQRRVAKQSND